MGAARGARIRNEGCPPGEPSADEAREQRISPNRRKQKGRRLWAGGSVRPLVSIKLMILHVVLASTRTGGDSAQRMTVNLKALAPETNTIAPCPHASSHPRK